MKNMMLLAMCGHMIFKIVFLLSLIEVIKLLLRFVFNLKAIAEFLVFWLKKDLKFIVFVFITTPLAFLSGMCLLCNPRGA